MAYISSAAITHWYAAYYDAWLGGQYFKTIDALHAEYGTSGSNNDSQMPESQCTRSNCSNHS